MPSRLIDVLTGDEKVLDRRVTAAKDLLAGVEQRVADAKKEHERTCASITRDKKAVEVLTKELQGLGAMKMAHGVRTNPLEAEKEYTIRKPDRYDVSIMEVPNHQRQGTLTFFVKMYWGNRCRILWEGRDGALAVVIAHNVAQLTGQDDVKHHRIPSKKNLFDT